VQFARQYAAIVDRSYLGVDRARPSIRIQGLVRRTPRRAIASTQAGVTVAFLARY
jgi:hypothetical protein